MGNPHRPTKSGRFSCTLSRFKKPIKRPVIRVVQIHNPVYVHTDAINFSALVQKLTGINTHLPAAAVSHVEAHPPSCCSSADQWLHGLHDEPACCRWSHDNGSADGFYDEKFDWRLSRSSPAQQSSKSCSGFQNYAASSDAEASSPASHTSDCSEGYDYEENHKGYGLAFSNMPLGVHRFSELDIWAGLASDHALPDITMLPPLVL